MLLFSCTLRASMFCFARKPQRLAVFSRRGFAVLLIALCGTSPAVPGQTLTITPATALNDEPVAIRATGLEPGGTVTIRSELTDGAGNSWQAEAQFAADESGSLDLTNVAALKGSYRGVSAMGLIWSMRPRGEARIYQAPRSLGPQSIRFTLRSKTGEARAQLEQRSLAPGVRMVQLSGNLHGVLFLPEESSAVPDGYAMGASLQAATSLSPPLNGPKRTGIAPGPVQNGEAPGGKRPALLVVGGSEGGTPLRRAAWLANHGYVALALGYFRLPELPDQLRDIPLEYFGLGLRWLAERPEVDPERIGVVGASRGGELALQLGSTYPIVHAVVAFVPANVRVQSCCDGGGGAAWTWHGKELAYTAGSFSMGSDTHAQIAVENTHGPILLISGQSDGVWPSSEMTAKAESRLKAAHFQYAVERLDYPKAGHRAGSPEIAPAWHGELRHPVSGRPEDLGGTPEGNAASGQDATPRVLAFLADALGAKASRPEAAPLSGPQ